jgi:glutamyl-tRNA synthetase
MTVRTRFEPSPSGSIHVGTAMVCSFNWFMARHDAGAFVLRVADTDASRVVPEGLRSVVEDLRWLGLQWDEGPEVGGPHAPYFQSERTELYRTAALALIESGSAYRCYCTQEEIEAERKRAQAEKRPVRYSGRCRALSPAERAAFEAEGRASVVRFAVPPGETRVDDLVRGESVFEHEHIEDFVILRANGTALYNLAVSYDDMTMEITHIMRGEDIFPSTGKQVLLMKAMGAQTVPSYGHVPLIVGPDRKPLGKRHGDTAIAEFRDKGFLPEVILNYLATLNWSVGDGERERFSVGELIDAFNPSHVTRNPSAFDLAKLTSWNGDTIRALGTDEFIARAAPFMRAAGLPEDAPEIRAMAPLVQERAHRLDEVPSQLRFFFEAPTPDEKAKAALQKSAATLADALAVLEKIDPWTTENISAELMAWADAAGIKRKEAFQPLRAAVAGSLISPPLFESLEVLGREKTIERVRAALDS